MWYLFKMDKEEKFIGLGHPFEKFKITDGVNEFDITGKLDNTMATRGKNRLVLILLGEDEFNRLDKTSLKVVSTLTGIKDNKVYKLTYIN